MKKGTVKWFSPQKGYGFILNPEGHDVFVHYMAIQDEGFRCLRSKQHVEYEEIQTPKGLQAAHVQVVETSPVSME